MSRTRIISLAVIVLSVLASVWSLGGGMFRERGFDFKIEGSMEAGEVPDTTGWCMPDLELDTVGGRYRIAGHAVRPCVVEVGTDEVTYCSTLFIERGRIAVEEGRATGTTASDARTTMLSATDSLVWSCPEGEYSVAFERGYDSLARAYIEANRANLYGGWLAERLSRQLPIDEARGLFEGLTSGVRRSEAVAPLRERVARDDRSQVGQRVDVLPNEVDSLLQADRYVVIDFWASWNVDEQVRADKLRTLTAQFDASELTVCRISMDNSREQWQSAIEDDPMEWIQLRGESCGLAIESLPISYLLSPKGRIFARADSIDELRRALEELF